MEYKMDGAAVEKAGDELIQKMLGDILLGLKAKMVQPVINGNIRIASRLEELEAGNQMRISEILERLEALESEVQKLPLVILTAIRDAINQAGGGNKDDN